MTERSDEQINEQLNRAAANIARGRSLWPGMSYEEGVDNALRWAMGWIEDAPMEDE